MNILNKFTVKSLKLNKKRTIVTIIGIILSTALICGVAGLVSSFQNSLINWTKYKDGNYHTTFYGVEKEKTKYITENQKVAKYFFTNQVGWAKLEGCKNESKPYVNIWEYDKTALENYGINLKEGRLPQNANEILIPEHIKTNARVNLKIGDKITFNVGTRQTSDGYDLNGNNPYIDDTEETLVNVEEKVYTIVGEIERWNYETYTSPGYIVMTYMENIDDKVNVSVLYNEPKEYIEINKNICTNTGLNEEIDTYVNSQLLRYQGVMSEITLNVLYTIAGIIIIIIVVSSIFVIRNSFSISVSEKNRQYGMLASIGATSKQIKKNVIFEGMLIGLIAIPLGIVFGIIAIIILLQVVNYLLADMLSGMRFMYSINWVAILISIIISIITIYLSCLIPARKAAKISPIESIRGNNDIKIKSKKLKTSVITKKLFGVGGVIASKNLKRSKKKYRTTVISLVVSIFIFISLSSFLTIGTKASTFYYMDFKFNMFVLNGNADIYEEIAKLDNVDEYAYYYETSLDFDKAKYASDFGKNRFEQNPYDKNSIAIIIYNNEYFKKYIKELGIKEENYKSAVILIDEGRQSNDDGSKTIERLYKIKNGDKINVAKDEKIREITITKCTDNSPMGQETVYHDNGKIIVSEDFMREVFDEVPNNSYRISNLLIESKKAQELESRINDLIKQNEKYFELEVQNYETYIKQEQRSLLVIKIFLYGFITVITLIGVTNIFNTITTNMILRSKEFAMLKSIGMTTKEFNRMIRLESIMYGTKSLLIGIPLGILGSYGIYKAFAQGIDLGYMFPYQAVIISIIFVFIIVGITMKYSLNRINKQNIIETIRKDNI